MCGLYVLRRVSSLRGRGCRKLALSSSRVIRRLIALFWQHRGIDWRDYAWPCTNAIWGRSFQRRCAFILWCPWLWNRVVWWAVKTFRRNKQYCVLRYGPSLVVRLWALHAPYPGGCGFKSQPEDWTFWVLPWFSPVSPGKVGVSNSEKATTFPFLFLQMCYPLIMQLCDSMLYEGEGLRPLDCWDCWFESRRRHECLCYECCVFG
jgi:hypothetical protein